ncbi:uncharacterized protein LOC125263095 [Megalobrama amblycephala]|uniref:uncharacterized protein LOC125263095 n=1 Tax=Megalobrama amblycephala TaxID=75352 RepID=UPI0020146A41|nr:uncharacterized protein LOC125263095 [Megalobrama amblycephala]
MSRQQSRCFVFGCTSEHKSLHLLPASEPLRTRWISFIFKGKAPENAPKHIFVCANHFTSDCFMNEGQYKAGFAKKLLIKNGSVPTLRHPPEEASTSTQSRSTMDVAVQTEPSQLHSVGTQLSMGRPQSHHMSIGVQTTVSSFDLSTASVSHTAFGTVMTSTQLKTSSKRPCLDLDDEDTLQECSSILTAQETDVTFDPAEADTSITEPKVLSAQASSPVQNISKYIVYETCIMELFEVCPVCQRSCHVRSQKLGTFLRVEQLCRHCHFSRKWDSQPIMGSTPAGNLHLSAAVYLCGASFFTIKKIFAAMKLQLFRYDTFRHHSRMCIEPAIVHKWRIWQGEMLQQISQREKVIVGGRMRADSPGHSAKYGSYTMMDLETNTLVDVQLVQSNEVAGSCHMVKEGLKRSLDFLDAHGVTLDCIVTDRHPQIQKFLRERSVNQFYDVGHIEKGISKKLEVICKLQECEKLRKWLCSIKNHIHWTAASSSNGPERVAKWTSILNHVQDKHTHEDNNFPACLHPPRQSRDKNKWLVAGSLAFFKLEKVLSNKRILKDVAKLSPHHQTSNIEVFHRVILRFAPKNVVFPFLGMLCRLYLAALHYNENIGHPQATTAAGQPQFKMTFPKAKKGEYRAREVKTHETFRYVDDLLDLIFDQVFVDPAPYMEKVLRIPIPPPLCVEYDRPEKEDAISSRASHFNL